MENKNALEEVSSHTADTTGADIVSNDFDSSIDPPTHAARTDVSTDTITNGTTGDAPLCEEDEKVPNHAAKPESNKKRLKTPIIIAVICAVALIGIGIAVVVGSSASPNNTTWYSYYSKFTDSAMSKLVISNGNWKVYSGSKQELIDSGTYEYQAIANSKYFIGKYTFKTTQNTSSAFNRGSAYVCMHDGKSYLLGTDFPWCGGWMYSEDNIIGNANIKDYFDDYCGTWKVVSINGLESWVDGKFLTLTLNNDMTAKVTYSGMTYDTNGLWWPGEIGYITVSAQDSYSYANSFYYTFGKNNLGQLYATVGNGINVCLERTSNS